MKWFFVFALLAPSSSFADNVRGDVVPVQQQSKPNVEPAPSEKKTEECVYNVTKELYENMKSRKLSEHQKAQIGRNTKDDCLNETHPQGFWDDAAQKAADKGLMKARDDGFW